MSVLFYNNYFSQNPILCYDIFKLLLTMVLKLGVLHCGGHPLGTTVRLLEALPPFDPIHLGVVLAIVDCFHLPGYCQQN